MKVVCFDLDDTLYKEIDYLKSAYREISFLAVGNNQRKAQAAYDVILKAYLAGGNAFNQLNSFLGINRSVKDYLEVYRNHKPDISLTEDVITTLDELKSVGCVIGLITDGRSVQQRHKIDALGLYRWISDGDIVISEEFGSEKPNLANYEYFMNRYSRKAEFYYVGDNPQKDFLAPNSLGWTTICMRDNGQNIHKYDERVNVEANYLIDNIKELLDIIPV